MSGAPWPVDAAQRIMAIFGQHTDYQAAHAQVCREVRQCSPAGMKEALKRAGLKPPREYLRTTAIHVGLKPADPLPYAAPIDGLDFDEHAETRKTDPVPPPMPEAPSRPGVVARDDLKRLVEFTRREPLPFEELCNRLDLSPAKARSLVDLARKQGLTVQVAHGHVGIASTTDERIQNVGVAPVVGERQTVGVISDTHFGSKYCLRAQIVEFVHHAYMRGAREILHPGDLVDGMYRHGLWEVSHMGLDAQADDLLDTLPQLPGLNYRCITGNHDETFEDGSGVGFGHYLTTRAAQRGRSDIHFYGRRSAFIRVCGAVVHLWHPRGSLSYAKSYKLQKIIEKYSSGEKPHLLLVGHFHQTCHVLERGVHGFLCPTFQGGGSAFGKSLGGAPTIGGMILSWEMTEGGTMRSFTHEHRSYYEVERPHHIDEYVGAREETPIVRSA